MDYNNTRADFESAAAGLNLSFEMFGGGYESRATACAWVGWCIRVQFDLEKINDSKSAS